MFNLKQLMPLSLLTTLLAVSPVRAQPLDDPMRPPTALTMTTGQQATSKPRAPLLAESYQLSAIRITKLQRSATINGKTVYIGSYIGNARVIAILASRVTLQRAGKDITVSLLPLSIKKPVEAKQP